MGGVISRRTLGLRQARARDTGINAIYLSILSRASDKTPFFTLDGRFMTVKITSIDPDDTYRGTIVFFIEYAIHTFWAEFDAPIPLSYQNCLVEVRIFEMIDGQHFRCEFVYKPQQPDIPGPNIYKNMSGDIVEPAPSPRQMPHEPSAEPQEEILVMTRKVTIRERTSFDDVIAELQEVIGDTH